MSIRKDTGPMQQTTLDFQWKKRQEWEKIRNQHESKMNYGGDFFVPPSFPLTLQDPAASPWARAPREPSRKHLSDEPTLTKI